MLGSAQPEDRLSPANAAAGDDFNRNRLLGETELDSALQLLVERAQYITGATGSALALPQGDEMVCRASAGASAPAVGARLQVRSGLTGESIARRQLLRCDNAEADPRVNLETCRALGIASIVVLPLLQRNGEVRGLFELFSDHPYAFEERDLVALERMADLTMTALDLAEQKQSSAPVPPPPSLPPAAPRLELETPVESESAEVVPTAVVPLQPVNAEIVAPAVVPAEILPAAPEVISSPAPTSVPEAMLRVQKCAACGFPVSEGRTLCLDCEKKDSEKKKHAPVPVQVEPKQVEQRIDGQKIERGEHDQSTASPTQRPEEFVPAFLANAKPVSESWLANHVNLLAILVLILGILVAVVVFR
jgi:putative methionine-R-sulfoxide reductase with GAF domain